MFYLLTLAPFITLFSFFNDTATTEIYTLSLHDALPISTAPQVPGQVGIQLPQAQFSPIMTGAPTFESICQDRKSTRLNSSHPSISYAVFCLKKKNKKAES